MKHIDVTLYFEERRLKAVSDALAKDGITVKDKLESMFQFLYEQFVPLERQRIIEKEIEEQNRAEVAAAEAKRRFAVYHIRENGEDSYFTSDHFRSFLLAAYRYRLYSRGELSDEPQNFADAFIETRSLSQGEYENLCDSMANDYRIKALVDFNLDEKTVSVCERSDNAWSTYTLHDASVAAYHAQRSVFRPIDERQAIFENALAGKEIETESDDEEQAPQIQSL